MAPVVEMPGVIKTLEASQRRRDLGFVDREIRVY